MRDFPIFTTDYGVASLVLKEIPYKKQAFICIRDTQPDGFAFLLQECVDFCTMAGAEYIFATGHDALQDYPVYTVILEMRGQPEIDEDQIAQLFPVTEQTVSRWREIYNHRMKDVDNAGTLEKRDEKRILESGGAYFVHCDGGLLGIGWIQENQILAVASVIPGAGKQVVQTLCSLINGAGVRLEVASTNHKAIRLYEGLGFVTVGEISRWYRVIDK